MKITADCLLLFFCWWTICFEKECSHWKFNIGSKDRLHNIQSRLIKAQLIIVKRMNWIQAVFTMSNIAFDKSKILIIRGFLYLRMSKPYQNSRKKVDRYPFVPKNVLTVKFQKNWSPQVSSWFFTTKGIEGKSMIGPIWLAQVISHTLKPSMSTGNTIPDCHFRLTPFYGFHFRFERSRLRGHWLYRTSLKLDC